MVQAVPGMKLRALNPMSLGISMERTQCAPWGLKGGKDGLPNRVRVRRADGTEHQPPNGKLMGFQLGEGDVYVVESGGGGGFGTPLERPVAAVLADVRAGYVSVEAARSEYGVVMDAATLEVDQAATEAIRSRLS